MVDGKRVDERNGQQRHADLHADLRARRLAARPHLHDRPRALGGADQGPLRVAGRPRTTTSRSSTTRSSTTTAPTTSAGRAGTRCSPTTAGSPPRWSPAPRSRARARATRAATENLLEHTYDALRPGNVVQQAHTRLNGRARQDMTLALGFATRGTAGARRRHRIAQRRLRGRRRRLQGGLDRVPQPAQADPGRGAAGRRRLRDLAARPEGPRGQGQPGRVRRLAEHALGLGRADDRRGQPAQRPLPPRLAARPLPGRDRAARRGRHRRRQPRARLRLRQAAARGRLVPAEHPGRRAPEVDVDPDGPGRPADRARLAARPHPAEGLAPRPRRRRLHRRARPGDRAGALGEPGGLLAGDDRGRDRRA